MRNNRELSNLAASINEQDHRVENRRSQARPQCPQCPEFEPEVLSGYLFYPGTSFSSNSTGQSIMVMMPSMQTRNAVAPSEPQRTRNFLMAVYQNLLARPISLETPENKQKAQRILFVGNHLAWQYSTYAPDLAPAAAGFLAQFKQPAFTRRGCRRYGGNYFTHHDQQRLNEESYRRRTLR